MRVYDEREWQEGRRGRGASSESERCIKVYERDSSSSSAVSGSCLLQRMFFKYAVPGRLVGVVWCCGVGERQMIDDRR